MAGESVLIIGAGGLGIVTGYHLQLAGAEVTFLVRENRMAALAEPQVLYCYNDHELKTFTGYKAFASVPEAMAQSYDFVIVTLDGATCRGQEAAALLRAVGDGMRDGNAIAVISGVGVREFCREIMGLPEDRVVEGTMGLLSYQTDRVTLPLNPPTDPDKLAQASMAYGHMGSNPGFLVANRPKKAAKAFAELYNRSGVSKCSMIPAALYATFTSSTFANFAIFDMAGWPDAETLAKNEELMTLGSNAMKEIMALPEHGFLGKVMSWMQSPRQLAKSNIKTEQTALPVDYSAFSGFHHGGKVREQDIGVLRHSLESGKAQGKSMPALTELLRRYETFVAAE